MTIPPPGIESSPSSGEAPILLRKEGPILIATLNRPAAHNGIDESMASALMDLAEQLTQDRDIEALVVTGAGRVFSAGGDVSMFKRALEGSARTGELAGLLNGLATVVHGALVKLVNAGPLLVAAVNGPATGAALGLICACDVAIGRPGATLRAGFSRLGISPDTGTTFFLPRLIGYRRALQFLLGGEPLGAESAHQLGIFGELMSCEDAAFLPRVIEKTQMLISAGTALRPTRWLLRESESASLDEHLQREQTALVNLVAQEAVEAQLRRKLELR